MVIVITQQVYENMKAPDCVFCNIIAKKESATIRYEDSDIIAFDNIYPKTVVHILIIPKKHIVNLEDTTDADLELLGKIQVVARQLAITNGIADQFRLATASGAKAGQSVFHLHYHLIGGWQGLSPQIWH